MGEIAEGIASGLLCCECGAVVDEEELSEPGYPRLCMDCETDAEEQGGSDE